jgi:hypothetical protein
MSLMEIEYSKDYGANPEKRGAIGKSYLIQKFWGQTHVYLPLKKELGVSEGSLVRLAEETFIHHNLGNVLYGICLHPDGTFICLPSAKEHCPSLDDRTPSKLQELFSEDPRLVFPSWFFPDEFVKKVYVARRNSKNK